MGESPKDSRSFELCFVESRGVLTSGDGVSASNCNVAGVAQSGCLLPTMAMGDADHFGGLALGDWDFQSLPGVAKPLSRFLLAGRGGVDRDGGVARGWLDRFGVGGGRTDCNLSILRCRSAASLRIALWSLQRRCSSSGGDGVDVARVLLGAAAVDGRAAGSGVRSTSYCSSSSKNPLAPCEVPETLASFCCGSGEKIAGLSSASVSMLQSSAVPAPCSPVPSPSAAVAAD